MKIVAKKMLYLSYNVINVRNVRLKMRFHMFIVNEKLHKNDN